jgi:hypothetical protein
MAANLELLEMLKFQYEHRDIISRLFTSTQKMQWGLALCRKWMQMVNPEILPSEYVAPYEVLARDCCQLVTSCRP